VIVLDEIPDVCSSCFYVRVSQTGPSSPLGTTCRDRGQI